MQHLPDRLEPGQLVDPSTLVMEWREPQSLHAPGERFTAQGGGNRRGKTPSSKAADHADGGQLTDAIPCHLADP